MNFISNTSDFLTFIIGFIFLLIVSTLSYLYILDKKQKKHTLRRNFPLLGRMRWIFEHWGVFIRPYFISNDREEKPFSRASRQYTYRSAKNNKRTEAFGSTFDDMSRNFVFVNSQFPYIEDVREPSPITFGEKLKNSYTTNSRFNVSGMSFGALSKEAILALSKGMSIAGGWLNTGEGGLSKYHLEGGADIVFQIGTAKYNCSNEDLTLNIENLKKVVSNNKVKMIEIKLSQGAKPGKGGILPASKVNAEIAETRGLKVGEASISPNRHVDIANNEDLMQMIYKIKKATEKPTGIKLCIGSHEQLEDMIKSFKDKINSEYHEWYYYIPDFISLDSSDGGTGAAPSAFMDAMGMNILESLPLLIKKLKENDLKKYIKVIPSGKLVTPIEVAWAFANCADAVVSARGFLFSLGCIQARVCNKNKCPTGITTHKKKYTKGLDPINKSIRVANYHKNMTRDLIDIANACGERSFEDMTLKNIRTRENITVRNV